MGKKEKRPNKQSLAPDEYLDAGETARLLADVISRAARRKKGSLRAWTNEIIIIIMLATGLRAEELLGLKKRDLPCCHGKNAIFVPAEIAKNKKSRTVYIPYQVAERISEYVGGARKGAREGSRLFVNERGGTMSYYSLYSKVKIIGRNAGMPWVGPHKLRHAHLTSLYNVDYDLRHVQDQAGHTSIKSTQIYTRTDNRARRSQVERLDICKIMAQLQDSITQTDNKAKEVR